MPSGRPTHAAGHASTGIAPISASTLFSLTPVAPGLASSTRGTRQPFGPLHPKTAPCNMKKLDFVKIASNRHPRISNRHLERLEFTATPAKSTSSLFLSDTKRPHFTDTHLHSPETLVAQACPACVRFPSPSAGTHPISTMYSMQLEIAATPTPSTKLPTLLNTHSHVRPVAVRLHRPAVAFPAPVSNTFPETSGGLL